MKLPNIHPRTPEFAAALLILIGAIVLGFTL